jgi:hypothetical protein
MQSIVKWTSIREPAADAVTSSCRHFAHVGRPIRSASRVDFFPIPLADVNLKPVQARVPLLPGTTSASG